VLGEVDEHLGNDASRGHSTQIKTSFQWRKCRPTAALEHSSLALALLQVGSSMGKHCISLDSEGYKHMLENDASRRHGDTER
jgi:hypothetical protein